VLKILQYTTEISYFFTGRLKQGLFFYSVLSKFIGLTLKVPLIKVGFRGISLSKLVNVKEGHPSTPPDKSGQALVREDPC
jgi:hypothetical protein